MQCDGHIYWFILLAVLVVAVILVSSIVMAQCSVGDRVGIHLCSVLLVIRIIILTLVVWVSYMLLVDFYFIFALCDINVVDLMNFLLLMFCLVMIRGSKFIAFLKAVCRFSGRSWLNLPVISSLSLPYSDDA